jgi:hypothetical protein
MRLAGAPADAHDGDIGGGQDLRPLVRRWSALVALLAPVLLLLVACGGDDKPAVAVIGHQSQALGEAVATLNDRSAGAYKAYVGDSNGDTDLLLVAVNAPDGPMPGLREALNRLNGKTVPRAAVLYTQSDRLNDPELIQLVQLEVNELLQRYGVQGLDVIRMPGDQLDLKVKGLLALPARNVRFTSPQ